MLSCTPEWLSYIHKKHEKLTTLVKKVMREFDRGTRGWFLRKVVPGHGGGGGVPTFQPWPACPHHLQPRPALALTPHTGTQSVTARVKLMLIAKLQCLGSWGSPEWDAQEGGGNFAPNQIHGGKICCGKIRRAPLGECISPPPPPPESTVCTASVREIHGEPGISRGKCRGQFETRSSPREINVPRESRPSCRGSVSQRTSPVPPATPQHSVMAPDTRRGPAASRAWLSDRADIHSPARQAPKHRSSTERTNGCCSDKKGAGVQIPAARCGHACVGALKGTGPLLRQRRQRGRSVLQCMPYPPPFHSHQTVVRQTYPPPLRKHTESQENNGQTGSRA